MPEAERPQPHLLRVFLSSPGDVGAERELARRLIKDELPYDAFLGDCFGFHVVSWDDPAARTPMPAGMTPQEAVNRFKWKPSQCEIVVVVLWSRLGTHLDLEAFARPDGQPFLSGTEWEFEDAWGAKPRPDILVYRRTEKPRVEIDDPDWQEKRLQYGRVARFMERFTNKDRSLRGGWTEYDKPEAFGERLANDLRRLLRERLEVTRVAAEKGVPVAPLREVLARYGEHEEVPEHEIPARLARWAEEFAATRERLERATNDRPEAGAARHHAASLIQASDLEGAQAVLAEARWNLRESRQQTAQEEAAILADEAWVHRLRLDYTAAADVLLEAAGLVADFDPTQALDYALEAGQALTDQGHEFGDNAALGLAIEVYQDALALAPRAAQPENWALTQANLGNALRLLGEREAGTARLEQAVAACRAVLEERTRERSPLDWARAQSSLGAALWPLGEREASPARLEAAVAAFRAALQEQTRKRDPLGWAWTQNALGLALLSLGLREAGAARPKEAVAAFRAALKGWTRKRAPLEWAMVRNNLGYALLELDRREADAARLDEAVAVLRAALEEWPRERVPLGWARAQDNLGAVLVRLGEREAGTARLDEAVAVLRAALEERTRERVPLDWAETQHNLARAVAEVGTRTGEPARLREALDFAEAALEAFETAGVPHRVAEARAQRDAICAKLAGGG